MGLKEAQYLATTLDWLANFATITAPIAYLTKENKNPMVKLNE